MRHQEAIFAGFGGQGVLCAGQLLAYAGMSEGLHVTWIPSYGPEMRGGTANCTVILSEDEIGAPVISHPLSALVFNAPSMEKYAPLVKPGGLLLVNSSLIAARTAREDLRVVYIPASDIATELGNIRIANMVLLGAYVTVTGIVSLDSAKAQLDEHLSDRQRKWLQPNIEALDRGATLAR